MDMATRTNNSPGGIATVTDIATSIRTDGDTICAIFFLRRGSHTWPRGIHHGHNCLYR
jgi:hypothetical protein